LLSIMRYPLRKFGILTRLLSIILPLISCTMFLLVHINFCGICSYAEPQRHWRG
jgi:hypothetical protein